MSGAKCHCEEGLPEWIMSYADMITILMAFFVVMYSMAGNKDTSKEQAVLKSLRNQFGPMLPGWGLLVPDTLRPAEPPADVPYKGGTKGKNKNHGGADKHREPPGDYARVHAPWPGEQSRVGGVIFFPDHSSKVSEAQERSLRNMAAELGGKPQKIEIRGHTSRKLGSQGADARDHWDLAYERCRATMKALIALGIDPRRIRLSVAGEHEPVDEAGVQVPEAGSQNSRVEVFMLSEVVDPVGSETHSKTSVSTNKTN